MATTTAPLASQGDFLEFGSNQELMQPETRWPPDNIDSLMLRATRSIESRCDRRLAPFTGLLESSRAIGVAIDGSANDDVPLDLRGALGRAQSMAYGATALVRDFWLEQYAPVYSDNWTYTIENIELVTAYGGTEQLFVPTVEGPEADTGHVRLQLGTFCPPGTTVRFTYSGGYVDIPEDLNLACIFQAMKFVLLGAEPELRASMSYKELEYEIMTLIAPFVRY